MYFLSSVTFWSALHLNESFTHPCNMKALVVEKALILWVMQIFYKYTAGPRIMSFHSMPLHYNADEDRIYSSLDPCLCGGGMFSTCLRGFSLGALVSSLVQRCAREVSWHIPIVPSLWVWVQRCVWGGECTLWGKGVLPMLVPSCTLSCQDRLRATTQDSEPE